MFSSSGIRPGPSPSVALEKGLPRLRKMPKQTDNVSRKQNDRRPVAPSDADKKAAAIFVLFTFVILVAALFGLYRLICTYSTCSDTFLDFFIHNQNI